jgi:hypothetical protein
MMIIAYLGSGVQNFMQLGGRAVFCIFLFGVMYLAWCDFMKDTTKEWHQILCKSWKKWPPLWSSGQSSWLQIQRYGFNSRSYRIFWEVVGLQRGPLSLMSTIQELRERKSSGSGLSNQEYSQRSIRLFVLTSPTSGGRLVGIVSSRTQATDVIHSFLKKCQGDIGND